MPPAGFAAVHARKARAARRIEAGGVSAERFECREKTVADDLVPVLECFYAVDSDQAMDPAPACVSQGADADIQCLTETMKDFTLLVKPEFVEVDDCEIEGTDAAVTTERQPAVFFSSFA